MPIRSILLAAMLANCQPPAGAVLEWSRSGGFAGFCDELRVWPSGRFEAASCKPDGKTRQGTLPRAEADKLERWLKAFGKLKHDSRQTGVDDGMAVTLELRGSGKGSPSEKETAAVLDWAAAVFTANRPN